MAETWRERVALARERGRFTGQDRARAARWSTCAVGELGSRRGPKIVQLENGRPVDATFSELGTSFFAAVLANDVARAEATLAEIENHAVLAARAATLRPRPRRRPRLPERGNQRSATMPPLPPMSSEAAQAR